MNEQSDVHSSLYRLNCNLVPLTYDVELVPCLGDETVVGAVDIWIRVRDACSNSYDTITLHSLNVQLRERDIAVSRGTGDAQRISSTDGTTPATLQRPHQPAGRETQAETWHCVELHHHSASETVQMRFDHFLPGEKDATFVLHISHYIAAIQPAHLPQGLYRGTKDGPLLLTHIAPCNARRVVPCFDEPALRASWRLTLVVPVGCTAVSNSPIEREEAWQPGTIRTAVLFLSPSGLTVAASTAVGDKVGDKPPSPPCGGHRASEEMIDDAAVPTEAYKKVIFHPTPPLSSCEIGLVVGSFASLEKASREEGILCRILFDAKAPSNAGWYALDFFTKAVDFFHHYFMTSVASLRKLDMVVVNTPHDPYRSYTDEDNRSPVLRTDSWGMIALPDAYALVTEATPLERRQRIARLIGFEVCRHWLRGQWWTEAWLLNGLCVYLSYAFADAMFPNWGLWSWFTCTMIDAVLSPETASLSRRHTRVRRRIATATPAPRRAHHDTSHDICTDSSLVCQPRSTATPSYRGPRQAGALYDEILVRRGAMAVRTLANLLGRRRLRSALRQLVKRGNRPAVVEDAELGFTCDAFCACVFEAAAMQSDVVAQSDGDEAVEGHTESPGDHGGLCTTQDDAKDSAPAPRFAVSRVESDGGRYDSPCQREASGLFASNVRLTRAMVNAVVSASCGTGCPYVMARVTERGYVLTRHAMPNAYNGVLSACARWQSERRATAALDPLSPAAADVSFTWQPSTQLPYLSDSTAVLLTILQFSPQRTAGDLALGHLHYQVTEATGQSPIRDQRGARECTSATSVSSTEGNNIGGASISYTTATMPPPPPPSMMHGGRHGDIDMAGSVNCDQPIQLTQTPARPVHTDVLSRAAQDTAPASTGAWMSVQLMVGPEYIHVPHVTRTATGEAARYSLSLDTTAPTSSRAAATGAAVAMATRAAIASWPLCYFNAGGSGAFRCDYDLATWRRIIDQAAFFSDEDRVSITMTLTRLWSAHVGRFPGEHGDRCSLLLEWLLAITMHHNTMNCVLWDYITDQLEQMVFLTQNYLCHDVFCAFVCSLYTILRQRGALSFFAREKAESFQARRHLTRATTIKVLRLLAFCGSPALISEAREVAALLLDPLTAPATSSGVPVPNATEYTVAPLAHCRPLNGSLALSSTPLPSAAPDAADAIGYPLAALSERHTGGAAPHDVVAATAPSVGATAVAVANATVSNTSIAEGWWGTTTSRLPYKDGRLAEERGDRCRILCTSRMDFHDEDCARAGGIALQYLVESSRLPYWLILAAVMAEVHHVPTSDLQAALAPETLPALALDGVAATELQLLARIAAPAFYALDDERVFGFMRQVLLAEMRDNVNGDPDETLSTTRNACEETTPLLCAPSQPKAGATRTVILPLDVLKALYRNTHFIAYICEQDMPPSLLHLLVANGGDYCSNSNLIALLKTRVARCTELAPGVRVTMTNTPSPTHSCSDLAEVSQTANARAESVAWPSRASTKPDEVGDCARDELREMLTWMEANCTWMDYCCEHYDRFLHRVVRTVARTSSLADSDQLCGVSTPLTTEPVHEIHTFSMQSVSI